MGKLVSRLEKRKPSPISPYLFHLYNKFECLREGETVMLETIRYMLEFDVTLEAGAQPDPKEDDSDQEPLSSTKQQRLQTVSPRAKKKQTYKAIDGKTLVQMHDWKGIAMTLFNFEDNPFRRF